jgi:hypothetical protein
LRTIFLLGAQYLENRLESQRRLPAAAVAIAAKGIGIPEAITVFFAKAQSQLSEHIFIRG